MIINEKKIDLIKAREQLLDIMEDYVTFAATLPPGERYDMYLSATKELGLLAREYKQEIEKL